MRFMDQTNIMAVLNITKKIPRIPFTQSQTFIPKNPDPNSLSQISNLKSPNSLIPAQV